MRAGGAPYRVVGALATSPVPAARIAGVRVLASGELNSVLQLLPRGGGVLILASPPASRSVARTLLARAVDAGLRVLIARAPGEDGPTLRPLSLSDLVGAPMGEVDWDRVRAQISGRKILVTGGAGSIGGELSRRIAGLNPAELTILDNSEFNLFTLGCELAERGEGHSLRFCDIRDAAAVRRVFARAQPDIVFHAAAMKHVPLVEANPSEGVLTNVLGERG
jgi:O-antigen biosynthesis protein WbqV